MPSRLGPRFAIEAIFLIAVAVAVGVADLEAKWIVAVMAGAWLLTALVEWAASMRDRWTVARPVWPGQAQPEAVAAVPMPVDSWEETAVPAAPVVVSEPEALPDDMLAPAEAAQPEPEAVAAEPEPTPTPEPEPEPEPEPAAEAPEPEPALARPEPPTPAEVGAAGCRGRRGRRRHDGQEPDEVRTRAARSQEEGAFLAAQAEGRNGGACGRRGGSRGGAARGRDRAAAAHPAGA